MIVEFFGPYDKLAEKKVRMTLEDSLKLKDVLMMIADRYPGLARYCHAGNDTALSSHMTIIRNGTHLKLADKVHDEDTLSFLLPATGG